MAYQTLLMISKLSELKPCAAGECHFFFVKDLAVHQRKAREGGCSECRGRSSNPSRYIYLVTNYMLPLFLKATSCILWLFTNWINWCTLKLVWCCASNNSKPLWTMPTTAIHNSCLECPVNTYAVGLINIVVFTTWEKVVHKNFGYSKFLWTSLFDEK